MTWLSRLLRRRTTAQSEGRGAKRNKRRNRLLRLEGLEVRQVLTVPFAVADSVNDVGLDSAGNTYVSGNFHGWTDFDPGPGRAWLEGATTENESQMGGKPFLAKYSAAGELEWARKTLDEGTNLGVVGGAAVAEEPGGTFIYTKGRGQTSTANPVRNIIAKYDADGNVAWSRDYTNLFAFLGVAPDGDGNVYLSGYFSGTQDFDLGPSVAELTGSDPINPSGQVRDGFVLKLDANGDFQQVWHLAGIGDQRFDALVYQPGELLVGGYFSADLQAGSLSFTNAAGSPNDGALLKLDLTSGSFAAGVSYADKPISRAELDAASGGSDLFVSNGSAFSRVSVEAATFGEVEASIRYDGQPIRTISFTVAADGIYSTGDFGDFGGTHDFDPGTGTYNLSSAGFNDAFLAKYDRNGGLLWAKDIGASISSGEFGTDLAVSNTGTVRVGGRFLSPFTDFNPAAGTATLDSDVQQDGFVASYDTAGNFQSVIQVGGQTTTVDNGDAGYSEVGSWQNVGSSNGYKFEGDSRVKNKGNGSAKATWTLTGLDPNMQYEVMTAWSVWGSSYASNAQYSVNGVAISQLINQRVAPDDYLSFTDNFINGTTQSDRASHRWERVGTVYFTPNANGTITVSLSDKANGKVVADVVRVVPRGPIEGGFAVAALDAGAVDYLFSNNGTKR